MDQATEDAVSQADAIAGAANGTARDRLLYAAMVSFAAKGFHGTSTRDIALAANLSPAAVYVHYQTKEELLYHISKIGHQETLSIVSAAFNSTIDPVKRLRAIVHDFTLSQAKRHMRARIVNYELAALNGAHRAEVTAIRRQIETCFRQAVEAGLDSGDFVPADSSLTAHALISLGIDVARWYHDDGRWTAEQIAEHYATHALGLVGSRRGGPRRPARPRAKRFPD
jgi:AcrR family transcriptional regulator